MSDTYKSNNQSIKKSTSQSSNLEQYGSILGNDHHAYLIKKSERLASALHVVTGSMSPVEPIRQRLRDGSLDLVEQVTNDERLARGAESITARCVGLSAMIETAQVAGMISAVNARLISEEYASLARFVRDRYAVIRAKDQDLHDVSLKQSSPTIYKGQKDITLSRTELERVVAVSDPVSDSRRSSILSLFSNRDAISIRDAVVAIPNVSEKTIQRELLAMVTEGVLVKEGERRWSIYRRAPTASIK